MTTADPTTPIGSSSSPTTRLAWMTDLHLDFVNDVARAELKRDIVAARPDGVVIAGDIATATDVLTVLDELAAGLAAPLWFVLGNHDFYHDSIADVRARAEAGSVLGGPRWLQVAGPVRLSQHTALVGVDGWGDARLGDFAKSSVVLNDFLLIDELSRLPRDVLRTRLAALGDAAAAALQRQVDAALAWASHVVVATHVPPFREACWHEGAISGDDWLPFFTCAAVGEVLRAAAVAHPQVRLTVLCGHTHSAGEAQVLPNLRVLTGGARYGMPQIQSVLIV